MADTPLGVFEDIYNSLLEDLEKGKDNQSVFGDIVGRV